METGIRSAIDFSQIISETYNSSPKVRSASPITSEKIRKNQLFWQPERLLIAWDLARQPWSGLPRSLGFTSYPAMRTVLQEAFRQRVTHSARLRGRLEDLRQGGDIFERLVVSEMDYLTQALETVDRQALQKAVELFHSCERIFVFGTGPSVSLVELMEIRLRRFGRQVIPLTTAGREILEPLILMNERDLLFMIGFFDVSPTQQLVLDYANEVNCPIIILNRYPWLDYWR